MVCYDGTDGGGENWDRINDTLIQQGSLDRTKGQVHRGTSLPNPLPTVYMFLI